MSSVLLNRQWVKRGTCSKIQSSCGRRSTNHRKNGITIVSHELICGPALPSILFHVHCLNPLGGVSDNVIGIDCISVQKRQVSIHFTDNVLHFS